MPPPVADGSRARSRREAPGEPAPFVVREKLHDAAPMNLEQALFEMELVGHDFYLYVDDGDGTPSVVYRRHGYDYGVVRLHEPDAVVHRPLGLTTPAWPTSCNHEPA